MGVVGITDDLLKLLGRIDCLFVGLKDLRDERVGLPQLQNDRCQVLEIAFLFYVVDVAA